MPLNIQEEIRRLPLLSQTKATSGNTGENGVSPLQIVSKQGRLIMRLSASSEALNQRYEELVKQQTERGERMVKLEDACHEAERRAKQVSLTAIQLMDALDWVHEALLQNGQETFARDVEAAQKDCLRRLASVGITEIAATGLFDGSFHEGLDTEASSEGPKYHIVKVIRRGFQNGAEILRRAGVVTAA
jgi:molecular chaperone GrpE (heat shock protein)